jgi:preprotein translocase subunit SecE
LIDEILQADEFMMTEKQEKFWEEVKQEINKL